MKWLGREPLFDVLSFLCLRPIVLHGSVLCVVDWLSERVQNFPVCLVICFASRCLVALNLVCAAISVFFGARWIC